MKDHVTVVIVNWNTNEKLEKLLSQVSPSPQLDIVVVDNASDKSIDPIKKKYPHISFIINTVNRGYAAACNQGALKAKGEWLMFLNTDVDITNEILEECIKEAEEKKLDAACPSVDQADYQKPLPSLLSLLVEFSPLHRIIPLSMFEKKTLFGGALLLRRKVFVDIDGWDERFFVWFEDSDITKSLYLHGAHVGTLQTRIGHEGGISFRSLPEKKKFHMFFHSLATYLKKHHSTFTQKLIAFLTVRFWQGYLNPQIHEGLSLVIPNMKKNILDDFLSKNKSVLEKIDECIIVSSDLHGDDLISMRLQYPNFRFISIKENHGFAHTVNIGFRAATGKYIATCNDDVILNESSFSFLKNMPADAGSVNPVVKKVDGSIESAGITILQKGKAETITEVSTDEFHKVDATNGAAVVYTREALEKIGLFDERFGSYLEDIDIALRCAKAGFNNYVHNASHVTHLQHQTSSSMGAKKQWLDFKNWILVIIKNWPVETLATQAPQIILERSRNLNGVLKSYYKNR